MLRTLSCVSLAVALDPAILAPNASLSGRVFDQSQLAVPGATVVIAERRTSIEEIRPNERIRSVQPARSASWNI
jgi:hypothetical protein